MKILRCPVCNSKIVILHDMDIRFGEIQYRIICSDYSCVINDICASSSTKLGAYRLWIEIRRLVLREHRGN